MPAATEPRSEPSSCTGWLVSPWVDTLFFANLGWPLVFLLGWWDGLDAHDGIQFWQVYFVTTPHRWITLALVFADRRQFRQHPAVYVGAACAVLAFCLTVRVSTGTLTCLLAIDYLWNGWHFAAQHHGIFRIYGRLSQPARTVGLMLEKVLMRAFVLYVIVRVAGGSWPWEPLEAWLHRADWTAVLVPCWLLWQEVHARRPAGWGRLVYLTSVMTLYLALLLSVHFQQPQLVLVLATASALFHATEYLAIVSWAVQRKHGRVPNSAGLFGYLAPRWGLALGTFATVLGLGGWLASQHLMHSWALLNVMAAYLHYTYDGMIWKLRRPASYAN